MLVQLCQIMLGAHSEHMLKYISRLYNVLSNLVKLVKGDPVLVELKIMLFPQRCDVDRKLFRRTRKAYSNCFPKIILIRLYIGNVNFLQPNIECILLYAYLDNLKKKALMVEMVEICTPFEIYAFQSFCFHFPVRVHVPEQARSHVDTLRETG